MWPLRVASRWQTHRKEEVPGHDESLACVVIASIMPSSCDIVSLVAILFKYLDPPVPGVGGAVLLPVINGLVSFRTSLKTGPPSDLSRGPVV